MPYINSLIEQHSYLNTMYLITFYMTDNRYHEMKFTAYRSIKIYIQIRFIVAMNIALQISDSSVSRSELVIIRIKFHETINESMTRFQLSSKDYYYVVGDSRLSVIITK